MIAMSDTKDKLYQIIADQAMVDVTDVQDTSTLDDLGLDSLAIVEAVFAIEETFDVQVPFNANNPSESEFDITNVGTMVAAVEKLVADKA